MEREEVLRQLALAKLRAIEQTLDSFPRLKYAMMHHRNIRGEAMQFHDKPYLIEIYQDDAQEIVLQSSVQTGKSEFLIVSAHEGAERGLQVLYALPTAELRNQFVANRVDKLYEMAPHYQAMLRRATGTADSRGLKHFGPNYGAIFFAGSNSATTFIEKPIDMVIGDEIDRFDQANYEKADDRMTASPYKLKREASNPTVDNFAISKRFKISDQREWYVKCPCCNFWQTMDWFKNVVRQTDDSEYRLIDREWNESLDRDIFMYCVRCGGKLDRFTFNSQWVAKHPERRRVHGYLIHQMLSSYVRIETMWRKFVLGLMDETALQVFYNSMLGLTFAGKGSKLTDEMLNACKQDYTMPIKAGQCFMGVDVGKRLNVVIWQLLSNETLRLVYAGTVKDFEELDYLFARFEIVTYVIDSMPETRKATEYAMKRPGRGWIARYVHSLTEITKNDDTRVVSVDRTMILDRLMGFFLRRQIQLPRNAQSIDKGDFYTQLKIPTRVLDAEKNVYNWLGDPDHYFHAAGYALLAYMVRGNFKVIAIDPYGAQTQVQAPPSTLDEDKLFPPGTPESLKQHYRQLLAQAQAQGKMNSDE